MSFGLHEVLGCDVDDVDYLTIVRHPVARLTSHYHYLRQHPDDPSHVDALRPLEEWAETCDSNLMTLRLAGDSPAHRVASREQDPSLVPTAARNAERFRVIGLQERFAPSLALMARELGWGVPSYRSRKVADPYPPPSAAAIRTLTDRSLLDLELYEQLRRRVEIDLARVRRATFLLRLRNPAVIERARDAVGRIRGRPPPA
jgi:hypothetical protein